VKVGTLLRSGGDLDRAVSQRLNSRKKLARLVMDLSTLFHEKLSVYKFKLYNISLAGKVPSCISLDTLSSSTLC
jgi:hypothetical protein